MCKDRKCLIEGVHYLKRKVIELSQVCGSSSFSWLFTD